MNEDIGKAVANSINSVFPWVVDYRLTAENRAIWNNTQRVYGEFKIFLEDSTDEESVYHKAANNWKHSKKDLTSDIIAFLAGGHETTTATISSCLLYLKRNPDCEERVKSEIKEVLFK